SVRMALHDGLLAMSRSTPPVEDWLTGDVDTLADKKALAAVAQALDDAGVYSAMLVEADFSIPTLLTTQLTPEQLAQFEQLTQGVDPLRPFDALGTGLRVDEAGKPVATFVYHHADAATAKANATIIKNAFSKGFSLMKHRPLSELFAVQDVKVDGDVVIATIGFKEALPVEVWHMIANSDGPTTYG
ncbi:MAG: hypothetical protein ABI862_12350, partial [Ilumatobacteraceae bacterium]